MTLKRHTLLDIINEIKESLKNDNFIVALNTALIIPDICSEIEFPRYLKKRNGKAIMYSKWINEWVPLNAPSNYDLKENESWGAILYTMRNSLLHDLSTMKNHRVNKINFRNLKFVCGTGEFATEVLGLFDYERGKGGIINVDLEVNIECLCLKICEATYQFCKCYNLNMEELASIEVDYYGTHNN